MCQNLYDLNINESLLVEKINLNKKTKQRLLDMGLIKGSIITCVFTSPFKDPKAYLIKGTVLAIRKEDALKIEGKICDENSTSW